MKGSRSSVEAAVDFLLEKGVAPNAMHLGYASSGRSAANANPDTGKYDPKGGALGSFEAGTVEFHDSLYNRVDFAKGVPRGKHGFELFTDPGADADYLYSAEAKCFISLDTPRTVNAKARFVAERRLGGVFTFAAPDNGLLCNAAREGLGYSLASEERKFDMAPTYQPGKARPLGGTQ